MLPSSRAMRGAIMPDVGCGGGALNAASSAGLRGQPGVPSRMLA
jgi:hypothetical protein